MCHRVVSRDEILDRRPGVIETSTKRGYLHDLSGEKKKKKKKKKKSSAKLDTIEVAWNKMEIVRDDNARAIVEC